MPLSNKRPVSISLRASVHLFGAIRVSILWGRDMPDSEENGAEENVNFLRFILLAGSTGSAIAAPPQEPQTSEPARRLRSINKR